MMVPDELLVRVKVMIKEIGFRRAAWFCRVGRRNLIRWMHGAAEPRNGSVALLSYGVAKWEKARRSVECAVPNGTPEASPALN